MHSADITSLDRPLKSGTVLRKRPNSNSAMLLALPSSRETRVLVPQTTARRLAQRVRLYMFVC